MNYRSGHIQKRQLDSWITGFIGSNIYGSFGLSVINALTAEELYIALTIWLQSQPRYPGSTLSIAEDTKLTKRYPFWGGQRRLTHSSVPAILCQIIMPSKVWNWGTFYALLATVLQSAVKQGCSQTLHSLLSHCREYFSIGNVLGLYKIFLGTR